MLREDGCKAGRLGCPLMFFLYICAGWFTPRAEITNARAAMLGFAVVAALEWNAGVCFF